MMYFLKKTCSCFKWLSETRCDPVWSGLCPLQYEICMYSNTYVLFDSACCCRARWALIGALLQRGGADLCEQLVGIRLQLTGQSHKRGGADFTLKRRGLCSAPTKGSLMMSLVLQLCYWLFLITADYEVLDWLIESQWLWLLIIGNFSFNLHMNQRSQCSLLLWLLIIGSVWYWSVLPVAACGFEVFWWCVQGTW